MKTKTDTCGKYHQLVVNSPNYGAGWDGGEAYGGIVLVIHQRIHRRRIRGCQGHVATRWWEMVETGGAV